MNHPPSVPMPAVVRAVAVLDYLGDRGDAGFVELGRALAIGKPALSRLLTSLQAAGVVTHEGGRYRLVRAIGQRSRAQAHWSQAEELGAHTINILKELYRASGRSVQLFVPLGRQRMRIVFCKGAKPGASRVGFELPLLPYHGAAQVFLAHRSPDIVARLVERWRHSGQQVRCELRPLLTKLEGIRQQGYALEDCEDHPGVVRLAVPVPRPRGGSPTAVIVNSGDQSVLDHVETLLADLRESARSLIV